MSTNYDDLIAMPDGSYRQVTKPSIQHTARQQLYIPTDRKIKKTKQAMENVIKVLKQGGSITDACNSVDIKPSTLRYWRINDSQFDIACKDAYDAYSDVVENVANDRAVNGMKQEVYHDGEIVGTKTLFDNTLLTNVLRARKPDTWGTRTNKVDINANVTNINKNINIDIDASLEELKRFSHLELAVEYAARLEEDRKRLEKK